MFQSSCLNHECIRTIVANARRIWNPATLVVGSSQCKEWESHIIQLAFSAYDDEHYGKYDADDYVVIETEG